MCFSIVNQQMIDKEESVKETFYSKYSINPWNGNIKIKGAWLPKIGLDYTCNEENKKKQVWVMNKDGELISHLYAVS